MLLSESYEPNLREYIRDTQRPSIFVPIPDNEIDVNIIYEAMLLRSTGGTRVLSMKAPPVSTEFVRSEYSKKAQVGVEGSLFDAELPSRDDIKRRQIRKHGRSNLFGYRQTEAADSFPSGYGEKAARSLQREDTVYQLKSTFTTAAVAMSKLRARVGARGGNAEAISKIFAKMWGITTEEASVIPAMDVDGSEATRLAAMEDRAYHSVTGHPGHTGGFRVDMASVTPEAFGRNIPANWARIRTGAKAIMHVQTQGDAEINVVRQAMHAAHRASMTLSVTINSQPYYRRTQPWELALDVALYEPQGEEGDDKKLSYAIDYNRSLFESYQEAYMIKMAKKVSVDFSLSWGQIAEIMRVKSARTLMKTVELIKMHHVGRALLEDEIEAEVEVLRDSVMGQQFEVPAYKVTKDRLTSIMIKEKLGKDNIPDMRSHGGGRMKFDAAGIRAAGLNREMTYSSALNLAVFVSTMRTTVRTTAYALMNAIKDPDPRGEGKLASRLRDPKYFADERVRNLGKYLFDDGFISTLEMIVRNMVPQGSSGHFEIVENLWRYLVCRTGSYRPLPIEGGLPELIQYLRTSSEGWTLYYWARISIGKWHHSTQSGVLAPIQAGEEVDLLVMIKRGVAARAETWAKFYQSRYREHLDTITAFSRTQGQPSQTPHPEHQEPDIAKYVPPHQRVRKDLEERYERYQGGGLLISNEEKEDMYQKMAIAQVKKKFFKSIQVKSHDRSISVGVSDEDMREALIESYHARWISLQRRVDIYKETGKVFYLGDNSLVEHPWGELQEEFPESLSDVRCWLASLTEWAWTVPPDIIWSKLLKSISELWEDISQELMNVVAYIDECGDDSTDEQALINLTGGKSGALDHMRHSQSTIIPSFGYTPPYHLPDKTILIESGGADKLVDYTRSTTVATADPGALEEDEDEELFEDEDEEMDAMIAMGPPAPGTFGMSTMLKQGPISREEPTLTYREIWERLFDVHVDDDRIKRAFTLGSDTDLDTPHVDNILGPIVKWGEEKSVKRAWGSRMSGMAKRAQIDLKTVLKADM